LLKRGAAFVRKANGATEAQRRRQPINFDRASSPSGDK
jgi:hypothetical protein